MFIAGRQGLDLTEVFEMNGEATVLKPDAAMLSANSQKDESEIILQREAEKMATAKEEIKQISLKSKFTRLKKSLRKKSVSIL